MGFQVMDLPVSDPNTDPLRVIAVPAPAFSETDAARIAAGYYGLKCSARELVSERDRNFHLRTDDGREFVLKITNSAEDPMVTDFQIQALKWIEARRADVATPRVVPTLDGRSSFELASATGTHVTRLVTFLPGLLLVNQPLPMELCRDFGGYAAKLGRALEGFEHPGADQSLIWNMNEAWRLRDITHHIQDDFVRRQVADSLEHFEAHVHPRFPELKTQVVHNDMNPENVLIDRPGGTRIAGVIDFGDMVRCPLVVDVAVAASYMRAFEGNPLARIAEFVGAYHAVTPLELREIDLVFDLIRVRLATTVSVLHWRIDARGADDPYLKNSVSAESTAGKYLGILSAVPREHARQTLRQACASTDVALQRQGQWRTDQPLL